MLEYVFSGDVHIEILKRINVILKFLAKRQALKSEYLDLMWKASEGKHEASIRAVYETLIDIVSQLGFE